MSSISAAISRSEDKVRTLLQENGFPDEVIRSTLEKKKKTTPKERQKEQRKVECDAMSSVLLRFSGQNREKIYPEIRTTDKNSL